MMSGDSNSSRGLDDGAADVIAAAVVIEGGDAEAFGRGDVA